MNKLNKLSSVVIAGMLAISLGACTNTPTRQKVGTVGGAVVGGVVGNAVSNGSTLGTVGGAAVGGLIGHEVTK